ncbi:D(2) dopamine receptor-like [Physella acuta]|uniref:D(2) dopamine receptor-like n=1 Tax=Physella acuta TaxID=109671 RepID=UPI0027DD557D|nr:D(2) dopamine receptor-like [Physella acuta]
MLDSNFTDVTSVSPLGSQPTTTGNSFTLTGLLATSGPNASTPSLETINDERAQQLIPAMVVLGVLMVIGIPGNALVVYVFCFKMKTGTQNILIVCLAVFDLLSCCLSIPNEIADMRFFFMFDSVAACKIMRFINTFCAIGSIFTLLVIAVDRFRKICRPFKSQMRNRHIKLSLIPIIGGAIFFAWPAFVMYGLRTTETGIAGLFGRDCSTADGIGDTVLPLIYNLVLFLCFIILTIALAAIYFCVLRETNRHNKYMKRNSDFNLPSSGSSGCADDSGSSLDLTPVASNFSASPSVPALVIYNSAAFDYTSEDRPNIQITPCADELSTHQNNTPHPDMTSEHADISYTAASLRSSTHDVTLIPAVKTDAVGRKPSILVTNKNGYTRKDLKIAILEPHESFTYPKNPKPKRRRVRSKTTIIAFLVTLVFILSFLPHLSLQVAKLLNKGFDYNLQGPGFVAYNIFLRSYFINSVSNPFIYGALNVKFRNEVTSLIRMFGSKR